MLNLISLEIISLKNISNVKNISTYFVTQLTWKNSSGKFSNLTTSSGSFWKKITIPLFFCLVKCQFYSSSLTDFFLFSHFTTFVLLC